MTGVESEVRKVPVQGLIEEGGTILEALWESGASQLA